MTSIAPASSAPLKVLVVDDSAIVRKMIGDALRAEPGVEVVGGAGDPFVARDMILQLRPDVLTLDVEGKEQLALTKAIEIHPIRRNIQHADLLVVRRGEKVTVEVNVVVEGEAVPGTLVTQDSNAIEIEADALSIPQQLTVSVEGADIGTQFTAGSIELPSGVSLVSNTIDCVFTRPSSTVKSP